VILPGTKSTVQDMKALQDSGLAGRLVEFYARGGFLFGLCGGYQMLGRHIDDRHLRDNDAIREIEGLGLLPVVTTFETEKTTVRSGGWMVHPLLRSSGEPQIQVRGYEIHFGETRREAKKEATGFHSLFVLNGHEEGLADLEFRAGGTYLHNVFHNDVFRTFWLNLLRRNKGLPTRSAANFSEDGTPLGRASINEKMYDALAAQIREHLDVKYIMELAGVR
jgi:adenosylcobyric acid synthase